MIQRLIAWLCAFASKRCAHPDNQVTYDLTEGGLADAKAMTPALNWCRCCGAHRFVYASIPGAWRTPETYGDR